MPGLGGAASYRRSDAAVLNIVVPAEAKVLVNGRETTSNGSSRRFVSRGLEPGYRYTYKLDVEVERDGQKLSESKTVTLRAGQSVNLEFEFDYTGEQPAAEPVAANPVRTSVTLHVPAEAKLILAGSESPSTGEVREFSTTKLAPGQIWDGYTIRVELERDGQTVTREKTLSLVAGQTYDLSFDFDSTDVAQLAEASKP
jgi:uncharacterized protein (TIGR03000 family)